MKIFDIIPAFSKTQQACQEIKVTLPNSMSTTTERKDTMNKNNTIIFAVAAGIAAFATGCTTYDAGYATTTYVAEPVYGQPAYIETTAPTVYTQPAYIHTTIIDEAPPPPPPPAMYQGRSHAHGRYMDERRTHERRGEMERHGRRQSRSAPPAARSSHATAKPSQARSAAKPPQAAARPAQSTRSKPTLTAARPSQAKANRAPAPVKLSAKSSRTTAKPAPAKSTAKPAPKRPASKR